MSVFYPANVKTGPWEMTPLLLLVLLTRLAGIVLCQYDVTVAIDDETMTKAPAEIYLTENTDHSTVGNLPTDIIPTQADPSISDEVVQTEVGSGDGDSVNPDDAIDPTSEPQDEGLSPTIILVPVVLVVVIIAMVVCGIVINRKWNKKMSETEQRKEDSYLDGNSTEKVPMPMFEDDIPSVLELEMDELDQWMNNDA